MGLAGRLLLGCLALILAVPCGAFVLAGGVLLDPVSRDALGAIGLMGLVDGIEAMAAGLPPDVAIGALLAFLKALSVLLLLPPSLTALIGETLQLRALAWYGGASGLVSAMLPLIGHGRAGAVGSASITAGETRILGCLFLAGATSGTLYWLIARASWQRPQLGASKGQI